MMGQSAATLESTRRRTERFTPTTANTAIAVFRTDLGWFALSGEGERVTGLTIGRASRAEAERSAVELAAGGPVSVFDWNPELRQRLEDYARGIPQDFGDLDLELPPMTDFQRAIVEATRRIPYGETRTYAGIAEAAGSPRAARAVGNVMASNRFPVLIPCHRVVASGGKWGGFSAPQGVDLKRRMIDMESSHNG